MRFSLIIPHWNGKHHLDHCLQSVQRQTVADWELLLVDNGSTDGSQVYVRERYPFVRLIELGENRGFTGACHAGYAQARGEFVILLNNDTEVAENWLEEIGRAFDEHPEVMAVASKMVLFDQRNTLHTAGDMVNLQGLPRNRGVWQKDGPPFDREQYVFSACGGSSAYRRTILEKVGFLDDDFFFSCEDVDLGWRIQLAGGKVLYRPTARVYHKLKATGGNVTSSYYDGRNFLYLLAKNYPTSLFRHHWKAVIGAQLDITREALRHWRGAAARARLRGQIVGLLTLPKMLRKRRLIQAQRCVSDQYLISLLSKVDDVTEQRYKE